MIKHGNHGEERAEHMTRVMMECDRTKSAYPAELIQYLGPNATADLPEWAT